MAHSTIARRTGRGLLALRNRYVKRGEFLCEDEEFIWYVNSLKDAWRDEFPEFALGRTLNDDPMLFPWFRRDGDYVGAEHLGPNYPADRLDQAVARWKMLIRLLIGYAYPVGDFYRTAPPSSTRGRAFMRACLVGDPRRLVGGIERFFPIESVGLAMDQSEYNAIGIVPEEWEYDHPSQTWYIPVYPGMTRSDLEDAIPTIIAQIESRLGHRTVGARIEALKSEGLTHQGIADLLGLEVKTVQAHLRAWKQSSLPPN